jgi:hypothetical protein
MGKSKLQLDTPAIYKISVQGMLNSTYSSILNQFQINYSEQNGETETMLIGRVADQAALSGILNTLYELQMPVLYVECLKKL